MKFTLAAIALLALMPEARADKGRVRLEIQLEENGKLITDARVIENWGEKAEIRQDSEQWGGYSIEVVSNRERDLVGMTTVVRRWHGTNSEEVLHARFVAEASQPASTEHREAGKPTVKLTVTPVLE